MLGLGDGRFTQVAVIGGELGGRLCVIQRGTHRVARNQHQALDGVQHDRHNLPDHAQYRHAGIDHQQREREREQSCVEDRQLAAERARGTDDQRQAEARNNLGQLLARKGELDAAVAERADLWRAQAWLGQILVTSAADQAYGSWNDLLPRDADDAVLLASCYDDMRRMARKIIAGDQMNRRLQPEIETMFLLAGEGNSFLSSRLVKEVARLGGNVSGLVPEAVERRLAVRFQTPGDDCGCSSRICRAKPTLKRQKSMSSQAASISAW